MLQYVTTNPGKLREARRYLGDETIDSYDYDYPEIQAPTLEPIAAEGAREAYREVGEPVIVDDAGLFIDAFDGFPGPYSSFVETTIGVDRVWELTQTEPERDRDAAFRCVLAYCDGDDFDDGVERDGDELPVKCFTGVVEGEIVAPRGSGGFGYDPIFEHDGATFAELTSDEKNEVSHRGRALETFAAWYDGR
ncbi:RdgB/HAM1 family non-canonical purine NTP pyrophosphatase [Halonotius terrestris]|uniref:RdgB/HAM1 family non-canonical purine NTP pyrophosphatase n=1 Tax=Halonotius terrestris TaxID=2487750 RepID=A0A8J8PCI9_9EURY|nr:RdgB/HAM1 family non-canonical purine NTP pyrophosphatase [Halonotius terrestris]TQQ82692.1 RdgB/HAM1 family non-canonical purine NTP pyrophosphatase [Halonotius terrestris]